MWDYLPSFLQRASSPIVEIAVDDARGALYARTANSEVKWVLQNLMRASELHVLQPMDLSAVACRSRAQCLPHVSGSGSLLSGRSRRGSLMLSCHSSW